MPVRAGITRTPLAQSGSHAAFPGLCRLPGGRLLRVWRDGSSHLGGSSGRLFGQLHHLGFSADGGAFQILDDALDVRDPSVMVAGDGKVWLTYFTYNTPQDPACVAWAAWSGDDGRTFSAPFRISGDASSMAISAPLVAGPNGMLLAFAYGQRDGSTQVADSAYCYRSFNGGASWFRRLMGDGDAQGRNLQEPYVIRLRNGALLATMRYATDGQIATTASSDNGYSWGAVTPKFLGTGRPSLIELASGPTVCVYRVSGSPRDAVMRVSPDRGGTWGAQVRLDAAGPAPAIMSYVAMVETAAGLAAVVSAIESNASTSTMRGLFLLDTP